MKDSIVHKAIIIKKSIETKASKTYAEMQEKAKHLNSIKNNVSLQSILDDEMRYLDE